MSSERSVDAQLDTAFARFWAADRPSQKTRIDALRSTVRQPAPDRAALDEAARIAHGLRGVAAMYGFKQAARIALEIERCLDRGALGPDVDVLIDELDAALTASYRPRSL